MKMKTILVLLAALGLFVQFSPDAAKATSLWLPFNETIVNNHCNETMYHGSGSVMNLSCDYSFDSSSSCFAVYGTGGAYGGANIESDINYSLSSPYVSSINFTIEIGFGTSSHPKIEFWNYNTLTWDTIWETEFDTSTFTNKTVVVSAEDYKENGILATRITNYGIYYGLVEICEGTISQEVTYSCGNDICETPYENTSSCLADCPPPPPIYTRDYCQDSITLISQKVAYVNDEHYNETKIINCEFGCANNMCLFSPFDNYIIFFAGLVSYCLILAGLRWLNWKAGLKFMWIIYLIIFMGVFFGFFVMYDYIAPYLPAEIQPYGVMLALALVLLGMGVTIFV
jgi:hypothetical protein